MPLSSEAIKDAHAPEEPVTALEHTYVQRFKELYIQKHRQPMTDAEAVAAFHRLIALVRVVYTPIPRAMQDEFTRLLSATTSARQHDHPHEESS